VQNKLVLLFDSFRDPRDLAQMIHLGLAAGIEIELTGSSLPKNHQKVINIIDSWIPDFRNKQTLDHVLVHSNFEKRIKALKKQGYTIIGTSPNTGEDFFSINLSEGKHVIVFGSESSGLSREKMALMDKVVKIQMKNKTRFFTIGAVAPVFAYETLRQKKLI